MGQAPPPRDNPPNPTLHCCALLIGTVIGCMRLFSDFQAMTKLHVFQGSLHALHDALM